MGQRKQIWLLILVFVLGGLWAFAMRFALVEREVTHYHANFAIYSEGVRDPLERFTFYEEVATCSPDYDSQPESRAHMHDNIAHVVHVHEDAVTWGNFFENIGYTLGDEVMHTDAGLQVSGHNGRQLRFILNGKPIRHIANTVIRSEDVLLIDYSIDSEETLLLRYAQIAKDAHDYNQRDDPSACQGGKDEGFNARLKRTFGIE